MNKPQTPPEWFSTSIRAGLSQTYSLSLQGTPGADVFASVTIGTWIEDLWLDRRFAWDDAERDVPRIRAAFRRIRMTAERWPTLPEFVRALPDPEPVGPALPAKILTEAECKANQARLAELMRTLGK